MARGREKGVRCAYRARPDWLHRAASGTLAQRLDAVPRRKDPMLAEFWHKGSSPQGTLA